MHRIIDLFNIIPQEKRDYHSWCYNFNILAERYDAWLKYEFTTVSLFAVSA
jgi:hypothetical protein